MRFIVIYYIYKCRCEFGRVVRHWGLVWTLSDNVNLLLYGFIDEIAHLSSASLSVCRLSFSGN